MFVSKNKIFKLYGQYVLTMSIVSFFVSTFLFGTLIHTVGPTMGCGDFHINLGPFMTKKTTKVTPVTSNEQVDTERGL
jgi:hypothetical protein